jgi:glycosyltransferase involved in cell wall biosynthesis
MQALLLLPDDIHFFAVGGNEPEVLEYRTIAETMGLTRRVHLVEYTSQATVAVYQHAADWLIMYLPNAYHYTYHMSPIKIFEYMASEVPLIAADLPSVRDVLNTANACLVQPDDPKVLAERILWLADHPREGDELARQARKDVEQYSWNSRADKILAIVRTL